MATEGTTTDLVAYLLEDNRELKRKLKVALDEADRFRAYLTRTMDNYEDTVREHDEIRNLLFPNAGDS